MHGHRRGRATSRRATALQVAAVACLGVLSVGGVVALQPGGLTTLRITPTDPAFVQPFGSQDEPMARPSHGPTPTPVGPTEARQLIVRGQANLLDDLRESPALNIAVDLAEELEDKQILAVEPNVSDLPKRLKGFDNVELVSYTDALDQADVIVLLVDHKEFKALANDKFEGKNVVDTKGLLNR